MMPIDEIPPPKAMRENGVSEAGQFADGARTAAGEVYPSVVAGTADDAMLNGVDARWASMHEEAVIRASVMKRMLRLTVPPKKCCNRYRRPPLRVSESDWMQKSLEVQTVQDAVQQSR